MCLKAFHVLPTGEVSINQFMTFLLVLVSLTQFVGKDDEDVVEKVHFRMLVSTTTNHTILCVQYRASSSVVLIQVQSSIGSPHRMCRTPHITQGPCLALVSKRVSVGPNGRRKATENVCKPGRQREVPELLTLRAEDEITHNGDGLMILKICT